MAPPKEVSIAQGVAVDFSVAEGTPHVIAYRFWLQTPGSTTWKLIGEGRTNDDTLDHFVVTDPIASGTIFAYTLAVGGAANSPWRANIAVAQPGSPTGGAWNETGVVSDDDGKLGHEVRTTKVKLK